MTIVFVSAKSNLSTSCHLNNSNENVHKTLKIIFDTFTSFQWFTLPRPSCVCTGVGVWFQHHHQLLWT